MNKNSWKQWLVFGLVLGTLAFTGCGGDSSGEEEEDPVGDTDTTQEGLLAGTDDALAQNSTEDLAPIPVALGDIANKLLTTRIIAVISPEATVAQVNGALTDNSATLSAMIAGQPFVSLQVPAMADLTEAHALADALVATGAFVYARPGFATDVDLLDNTEGDSSKLSTPLAAKPGNSNAMQAVNTTEATANVVEHTTYARLPAAWNLKRAASHDASLVFPFAYAQLDEIGQYDQLPLLHIVGSGTVDTSDPIFGAIGNLGYQYLGIAAGEQLFNGQETQQLGADPVAIQYLDAYGFYTTGLDEIEVFIEMFLAWPANGNTVVLWGNNYTNSDQSLYRHIDRAWAGFTWRRLAHAIEEQYGPMAMFAASNNSNRSNNPDDLLFNSAFAVATLPNIEALVYLSEETSSEQQQAFIDFYNQTLENEPEAAEPLANLLIVGASDANGNESSFSQPGAHVRLMGENVLGPCLVNNPGFCDANGFTLTANTTLAATAQAAGLAAYLWHLDDQLTPADLLLRLQHAYTNATTPGLVDAWTAVLSLDTSLTNATLRKTLLDVSGTGGQPDGVFDELDVQAFLEAFDAFNGSTQPDWSVYDLNADGWTNGPGKAPMDLDVNNLPSFTSVNQTVGDSERPFDERAVSDGEILCYYVHSPLFDGNPEEIDSIRDIPDCLTTAAAEITSILGAIEATTYNENGTFDFEEDYSGELLSQVTLSETDTNTLGAGTAQRDSTITYVQTGGGDSGILTLSFTGESQVQTSYTGTNESAYVDAFSEIEIEILVLLNESHSYSLSVTHTGSASEYGRGVSYAFFEEVADGSSPVNFYSAYETDEDGAGYTLSRSGTLEPGFYRLTFGVDTSASAEYDEEDPDSAINSASTNAFYEVVFTRD